MKIKDWVLKIGIFLISIQFGCDERPRHVTIKKLLHANPTSFAFKVPLHQLRDTIIKMFAVDPQFDNAILKKTFYSSMNLSGHLDSMTVTFSAETSNAQVFGREYFEQPNTKDDIFLTQMADYWTSSMYFDGEKPFLYTSSFGIKLKILSPDSTLINIISFKPEIVNGSKCCSAHLGNVSLVEQVPPTTVEEYTLILYMAEKLGIKNMKPLQFPN